MHRCTALFLTSFLLPALSFGWSSSAGAAAGTAPSSQSSIRQGGGLITARRRQGCWQQQQPRGGGGSSGCRVECLRRPLALVSHRRQFILGTAAGTDEGAPSSGDDDDDGSKEDPVDDTTLAAPAGGGTSNNNSTNSNVSWSVFAILAAAFLNLLGFTMAGPITPALGKHFKLNVGASLGSLTSAYPAGMLLGLFLWPQLSDKIGRKPVIASSLLGSGLGLAAQSYAIRSNWSLKPFLAMRVLTGSFAGSSPVSKAYLADVGAAKGDLPRYLAWRDAASTLAYIFGPLLSGTVYEVHRHKFGGGGGGAAGGAATTGSLAFVIGISSAMSLLASGLVAIGLSGSKEESSSTATTSADSSSSSSSSSNSGSKSQLVADVTSQSTTTGATKGSNRELVACPLGNAVWAGVATVCVVSFLFNVGDSTFFAFFPSLVQDFLGLNAKAIGLAFTCFACISFTVSATISSKAIGKYGPVPTCVTGLSLVGMGLFGLSAASTAAAAATAATTTASAAAASLPIRALVFGSAALYYCGVPLYWPTIPAMLLQCVPKNRRGAVMGLDGAINTIARVLSPLFMGELYRRFGANAAFGVAGMALFVAGMTALFRRLVVLKGLRFREAR